MISYSNLLQKLNEKSLTKTALAKELGISSRTVAKISVCLDVYTMNFKYG